MCIDAYSIYFGLLLNLLTRPLTRRRESVSCVSVSIGLAAASVYRLCLRWQTRGLFTAGYKKDLFCLPEKFVVDNFVEKWFGDRDMY